MPRILKSIIQPKIELVVTYGGGEEKRLALANGKELHQMMEDAVNEAEDYRTQKEVGSLSLVDIMERNGQRYLGNHWTTFGRVGLTEGFRFYDGTDDGGTNAMGIRRATLNRIQPAVLANVGSKNSMPAVCRFKPTELRGPKEYWVTPRGGRKLTRIIDALQAEQMAQQAMAPAQPMPGNPLLELTPNQIGPNADQPLTEDQADHIDGLIRDGLLDRDDVRMFNDANVTKWGQRVYDNRWDRADGNFRVAVNEFLAAIFGHCPMRIQYIDSGPDRNDFLIENCHVLCVWFEPGKDNIKQCENVVYEYVLPLNFALALWPQVALSLDKVARRGAIESGRGYESTSAVYDIDYRRRMVRVRVGWFRHQPVYMTKEEALASGLVMRATLADPVMEKKERIDGQIIDEPAIDPLTGEPITTPREAFLLNDGTMKETKEGDDNWPLTLATAEIIDLPDLGEAVDVYRCRYLDIPIANGINIPIPYSMNGMGEPQRLEDINQQINRTLTIFGVHLQYYAWKMRYWRQSTWESLIAHGINVNSRPGGNVPIPDDDYDLMVQQGTMFLSDEVVLMPPELMQMLDRLLNEIDRISGYGDLKRGQISSMSGEALKELGAQAKAPLNFLSSFTENVIERLSRIMMQGIVDFVDEDVLHKILSDLTLPMVRRWREMMKDRELNFVAEIATGRASSMNEERQLGMAMWAGGGPGRLVTKHRAIEMMGTEDADEMERAIETEDEKAVEQQVKMQQALMPQEQPSEQPAKQPPKK